jgi:hypothetical protein
MIPRAMLAVAYATGRASYPRQVKGDGPDKKGYPSPPGWGFGVGLTISHSKKLIVTKVEKRKKWRDIVRQAKAHSGLWCQWSREEKKNFVSLFICFPKCLRIAPFTLLYVCNISSKSLLYSDIPYPRYLKSVTSSII